MQDSLHILFSHYVTLLDLNFHCPIEVVWH